MGQANSYDRSALDSNGQKQPQQYGFAVDGTFGSSDNLRSDRKSFKHPVAAFFHVCFKLSALVVYLFGGLNVTGRLLVGLRWWNYIEEDGQSRWMFENRLKRFPATQQQQASGDANFILFSQSDSNNLDNLAKMKGYDSTIFWSATLLSPVFWFFFLFSAVFSFNVHWVLFDVMALVLSGMNLYGYLRCRFGQDYSYRSMLTDYVAPKVFMNLMKTSAQQQQQQQQNQLDVKPGGSNSSGQHKTISDGISSNLYGQMA